MKPASIPIETIARLAFEGRVFRSFGYLLAARPGSLLAVPVGLATGDFSAVVDGCPVPWAEVFAAVDSPKSASVAELSPPDLASAAPLIAALFPPYGWEQDSLSLSVGSAPVCRVTSPDGVVFCWVPGI